MPSRRAGARLPHRATPVAHRAPFVQEIFSVEVPDPLWEGDQQQLVRDNRTNLDTVRHSSVLVIECFEREEPMPRVLCATAFGKGESNACMRHARRSFLARLMQKDYSSSYSQL